MHFCTVENPHCERSRRRADLRSPDEIFGRFPGRHGVGFLGKSGAAQASPLDCCSDGAGRMTARNLEGVPRKERIDSLAADRPVTLACSLSLLLVIDSMAPHLLPKRFPADARARRGFTAPAHS
jgi:hypothetical protein